MHSVCFDEMLALVNQKLVESPNDVELLNIKRVMDDMIYVSITFSVHYQSHFQRLNDDPSRILATKLLYRFLSESFLNDLIRTATFAKAMKGQ